MTIKTKLNELIGLNEISQVIRILKNLATSVEFSNKVILFSSQWEDLNSRVIRGVIRDEEYAITRNKIGENFIQMVGYLPEELEIIKKKVHQYIRHREVIPDGISLLEAVISVGYQSQIQQFKEQFEEYWIASEENTSLDGKEWQKHIDELGDSIINYSENLTVYQLKFDWEDRLWNFVIDFDRSENFLVEKPIKINFGTKSQYYEDIRKREDPVVRRKLLLWEEEYLSENYSKARNFVDDIRYNFEADDSQIYEYLLLSFIKEYSPDNIIRREINLVDENLLKKVLIYSERTQTSTSHSSISHSSTKLASLREIYLSLISAVQKFYQNITHDFIFDKAHKGVSKKREFVKRCIEISLLVHENITVEKAHPFFSDLLIEIEGGGKFDWLKFEDSKLKNTTTFDAIDKRDKLKTLLGLTKGDSNDIDSLGLLIARLSKKSKRLKTEAKNQKRLEKLTESCYTAYFLYGDERFKELIIVLHDRDLIGIEEDPINTQQPINEEPNSAYLEAIADLPKIEINNSNSNLTFDDNDDIQQLPLLTDANPDTESENFEKITQLETIENIVFSAVQNGNSPWYKKLFLLIADDIADLNSTKSKCLAASIFAYFIIASLYEILFASSWISIAMVSLIAAIFLIYLFWKK